MIIKADSEGIKVVQQLLDIALKQFGLSELNNIVKVLDAIEEIKEDEKENNEIDIDKE